MAKQKLLSGRVKVTPAANVTADRYDFLGLEQAEPNLGVAPADGYVLIYDSASPGKRNWSSTSLLSGGLTAQSAFDAANTANINAIAAGVYANAAYVTANSSSVYANAAYISANSAGVYANEAFTTANSAGVYANAGFTTANAAVISSQAAYNHANSAYETANSASSYANGSFSAANTADQRAVTSGAYANSAYQTANSAASYANGAFAAANNKLDLTGGTITGDLSVAGNLTISGNTTQIAVTTLNVSDPIIYLAANNYSSDLVGIGFVGNYNDGSMNRHAGLVRMEASNTFYLFTNYDSEFTTNTLNIANPSLFEATLKANVVANTVLIRNIDVLDRTNSSYTHANAAFDRANTVNTSVQAAFDAANNATDTWVRNAANAASSYANSAYIHANSAFNAANNATDTWVRQAANSASSYANGAFAAANTADQRAVTSGSYANSAYTQANTGVTNAAAASSYANSAFGVANSASSYANGAFAAANTADQKAVTSGVYANSSYLHANAAFDAANNATDTWVRNAANSASSYANSAYAQANTANTLAQAAFDAANTAGGDDTYARAHANAAYLHANAAFETANSGGGATTDSYARAHANAAYALANSGGSEIYVSSLQNFTSNGQNTVFALDSTPTSANQLFVYVDGVYQQASAYTLNGSTLTLSEALDANSVLEVRVLANTTPSQIGVTVDEFTGTGACTTFTLSTVPTSKNLTSVIVGGVPQMKSAYTITGSSITFTGAPANGASIEVSTYKGGGSYATSFTTVVDNFSGDGSSNTFTLSTVPQNENHTFIYLNGVYQNKSSYNISGSNVTFTEIATSNDTIEIVTVAGSEMNVNSSRYNSRVYTGTGACTQFTISSSHSANSILVFENGICQTPITDYTVSGTTLTFTTAPGNGVQIQIRELPV